MTPRAAGLPARPGTARPGTDIEPGEVTDSARRRLGELFERDVDVFPASTGSADTPADR